MLFVCLTVFLLYSFIKWPIPYVSKNLNSGNKYAGHVLEDFTLPLPRPPLCARRSPQMVFVTRKLDSLPQNSRETYLNTIFSLSFFDRWLKANLVDDEMWFTMKSILIYLQTGTINTSNEMNRIQTEM